MGAVKSTGTILDKIVAEKAAEVEALKNSGMRHASSAMRNPMRQGFFEALTDGNRPGRPIIAEIKKASPSAGVFRDPFSPEIIAKIYENNGARCISVITDEKFFQGSISILRKVRDKTRMPLLRKDFIIDAIQIEEAIWSGADAVLLIERILDDELLKSLYEHALAHELAVLMEVHDEPGLERVLGLDPRPKLIGINNRDLADFSVNVSRTARLLPRMPNGITVVSESGLSNTRVMDELLEAGVHAFLIGTALMKADDMGAELNRLVFGQDT